VKELLISKRKLKLAKFKAIIIVNSAIFNKSERRWKCCLSFRQSVMISSDLPFSKWEMVFKDPMVTPAAVDRLVPHSVISELNPPSHRMTAAQKTSLEV